MVAPKFQFVDARTVRADDGIDYDVLKAIDALPWVNQLCPLMPHQYAVLFKSPDWAWFALEAMVKGSPDSYKAYFLGYPTPNKYWEAPDGLRYWRTGMMLNRSTLDSVELPRRVDEGGRPIKDWDGPPWAPNGSGWYTQTPDGKWWPDFTGTEMKPCKACSHPPPGIGSGS